MKLVIVSVYDNGVGAFGRPVFVRSKGEAMRSFQDEVNKPHMEERPNQMAQHPQDFQLFYCGEFDDASGRFFCPEVPDKLADAAALVLVK